MLNDEMLTIDEVANYLKLKPQTIYKWAQSGKIPGAKFGKEWRFRRSLIEEWIDTQISSARSSRDRSSKDRTSNDAGPREAGSKARRTQGAPPRKAE